MAPHHQHRIIELPPQLANQIAAGEVVARPASIVKELVENAIDAGAQRVLVSIERAGTKLIEAVDDGLGMTADDAALAVRRHATSKIHEQADLEHISTLGFRGEALPSIAAVSRMCLRTRVRAEDQGTEVAIDGGSSPRLSPCGCAPGTIVRVGELFYNVPARRKFLRALATESAHVTAVMRAQAIANHGVHFELIRDGRVGSRWLSVPTEAERIADVLCGVPLVCCRGERGPITIEAHLSGPGKARRGSGGLYLFVNGRPVQDAALCRAVAHAYGDCLERGQYPVGAVFLIVPHELVDVNVHPEKAIVRFAHARAVTEAVHQLLDQQLAHALELPLRRAPAARWAGHAGNGARGERWQWTASPHAPATRASDGQGAGSSHSSAEAADQQVARAAPPAPSSWRLLAVLRDRWLVCATGDELCLVDRIAAARIAIEQRLRRAQTLPTAPSQRLLFPVPTSCDASLRQAATRRGDLLARLGFDLRDSGPSSITAYAVPAALTQADASGVVETVVAHLRDAGRLPDPAWADGLVRALALRAAHQADGPLTDEHARSLVALVQDAAEAADRSAGDAVARRIDLRRLESHGEPT